MQEMSPSRSVLISFLCLVILYTVGFQQKVIRKVSMPFEIFSPSRAGVSLDFSFRNDSPSLPFPPFRRDKISSYPGPTWVSVADFDNDGFEDQLLIYEGKDFETQFHLLRNVAGGSLVDVTEAAGLKGIRRPVSAVFGDFDNDGWRDLAVTDEEGKFTVFRNVRGKFDVAHPFFQQAPAGGDVRSIALVDYDRDGFLDVILASYFDRWDNTRLANRNVYATGGRNFLFRNVGGKGFEQKDLFHRRYHDGQTWTVGIADFTGDGFPDVYEANDNGIDRMFKNEGGRGFEDVTDSALGNLRSSFAMSAEVADIDNDLKPDIYVTNMGRSVFRRGLSSFWENHSDGGALRFENRAADLGLDKCGFAWGAKFFDFGRSGVQGALVVNSPYLRSDAFANVLAVKKRVAPEIRDLLAKVDPFFGPQSVHAKVPLPDGQRNCIYYRESVAEPFSDVTASTSVDDHDAGMSLALWDRHNDGNCTFSIVNTNTTPTLYQCAYQGKNHWVGFHLVGTKSNRDAIGARVEVRAGGMSQLRLLFPTNGFQSESSLRPVFGLGKAEKVDAAEVVWPSGKRQTLSGLRMDGYNEVREE